ncbi:MAG: hypothetical protein RJB62_569 [Pseudomonadota bacterium]|jgi:hypothetical protein
MKSVFGTGMSRAVIALLVTMGSSAALAQIYETQRGPGPYNVQTLNFDLWCRETQRYAAERCDARMADDLAAFESYRSVVERYELQYLMEREREAAASARSSRYTAPWVQYEDAFGR